MWYSFSENRRGRNSKSLLWWNHRRVCFDKGTESVVLFWVAFLCNLTGKDWICLRFDGIVFFEQNWYMTCIKYYIAQVRFNMFRFNRRCRLQLQYFLYFLPDIQFSQATLSIPVDYDSVIIRVARLAFFRPNFRNLALLEAGWPKKFYLVFWPFFGLNSSRLALKNSFGLFALFWHFALKKFPMKENITIPF